MNASPGDYSGQENGDAQYFFDYNVRLKYAEEVLGYTGSDITDFADGTTYIDIDALDPNFFTLDMFSADELLNSGNSLFTWYGYDHTGQKVEEIRISEIILMSLTLMEITLVTLVLSSQFTWQDT